MTKQERKYASLVDSQVVFVVEAIESGEADRAYEKTILLYQEAVHLRRAQIAANNRRRGTAMWTDAMKSLGLTKTPYGWE